MSRKFFRKYLPARERLHNDRLLSVFGRMLHNPNLWHLNRHSVSRGIGAGLWWAFIPVPGQTVLATLTALKLRGNVPLAIALTWVSNPLTMVPCAIAAYQLGILATRQPRMPEHEFQNLLSSFAHLDFAGAWHFVTNNIGRLWPFFVGSVILSTLAALVGYLLVQWMWRWNLVRRWQKRGHLVHCRVCHKPVPTDENSTCPHCGAASPKRTRIGLGFAAIARLAKRPPRFASPRAREEG